MEIMGPVAEEIDGKAALPSFGDTGKTKNGHSVVVKLTMGHLKILLGGDLNTKSEYYLIKKYTGIDIKAIRAELKKKLTPERRAELEARLEEAVLAARESLEVDIAKSCHHGSADFSSEFLQVLNPIATIISSGDEEPHCHPRPDTLGTIGKYSRGERSLIFSTELARSGKEFLDLSKRKEDRFHARAGGDRLRHDQRPDGRKPGHHRAETGKSRQGAELGPPQAGVEREARTVRVHLGQGVLIPAGPLHRLFKENCYLCGVKNEMI